MLKSVNLPGLIYALNSELIVKAKTFLKEHYQLTFSQYLTLRELDVKVSLSQVDIARSTKITQAGISYAVDSLLRQKLINVTPHNDRQNLVSITAEGKAVFKKAQQDLIEIFKNKTTSLKESELLQLEKLLKKLLLNISQNKS